MLLPSLSSRFANLSPARRRYFATLYIGLGLITPTIAGLFFVFGRDSLSAGLAAFIVVAVLTHLILGIIFLASFIRSRILGRKG